MQQDRQAMYQTLGLIKVAKREKNKEPILKANPWLDYGTCLVVARKGWLRSGVSRQLHFFSGKGKEESTGLFMRQYATGKHSRRIPSGKAVCLFHGAMTAAKIKAALPEIRKFLMEPDLDVSDIDIKLKVTLSIDTSPWLGRQVASESPDYEGELRHLDIVEQAETALYEFRNTSDYQDWQAAGCPPWNEWSARNRNQTRLNRSVPTITLKRHPEKQKRKQVSVAQ